VERESSDCLVSIERRNDRKLLITACQFVRTNNILMYEMYLRVIKPFVNISQPEGELGGFDKSLLDQFDDTLAAIHHLSKGTCYTTSITAP
jgi:hypothetical protein